MAVKIVSTSYDDDDGEVWAKLATLNGNREAVTHVIQPGTDDVAAYVAANEAAIEADILANGAVDERLTNKLRAREAKQLLVNSLLEGTTLTQVENYIDNNVTDLASAKVVMAEMAGQIWMLYQVAGLTLESID